VASFIALNLCVQKRARNSVDEFCLISRARSAAYIEVFGHSVICGPMFTLIAKILCGEMDRFRASCVAQPKGRHEHEQGSGGRLLVTVLQIDWWLEHIVCKHISLLAFVWA